MYLYTQPVAGRPRPLGFLPTSAQTRRRLRGLGQATAVVAATPGMVNPQSYCGTKCNSTFVQELTTAIQNRLLQWPPLPQDAKCTGPAATSNAALTVTKAASAGVGAAVGAASALTSAGIIAGTAAIPIVGAIVAPILAIVGVIFAHHAQAVQMQTTVLCENVPAANAALQQIDQGIAAGTITPAQAISAYSTLQSSFTSAMKSDPSYKTGDALWGYDVMMQAVCAQRALDAQAAAASGVGSGLLSGTGLPSWVLWGGAAVLAYLLL